MKQAKNNSRGFIAVVLVTIAAAVLLAMFVFTNQKRSNMVSVEETPQPANEVKSIPAIEDKKGLDEASSDLDGVDMEQFDNELNLLDADTANF